MEDAAIYTRAMFGQNAVHIPLFFVRQNAGPNGLILGGETGTKLAFGSKLSHVFVKGDMIFRPHLVIESKHCEGMGAAGIITSDSFCDVEEWKRHGKILLDLL